MPMPSPKTGYYLKDGTQVPGTTTVIGRFKDSGALMQWAFRQGKEGKASLYEERDKAASIGTLAHDMVEAYLRNDGPQPDEVRDASGLSEDERGKATQAFEAFEQWKDDTGIEIVATEMQLVSERFKYGGTPDAIGRRRDGSLCLLDWKTSNAVHSDYIIQLAAYKQLWDENHPKYPITGGFYLARFSKDHPDFEVRYWSELEEAFDAFVLMRSLYDLDKKIKARCR
jgi:hypothetical protein